MGRHEDSWAQHLKFFEEQLRILRVRLAERQPKFAQDGKSNSDAKFRYGTLNAHQGREDQAKRWTNQQPEDKAAHDDHQ